MCVGSVDDINRYPPARAGGRHREPRSRGAQQSAEKLTYCVPVTRPASLARLCALLVVVVLGAYACFWNLAAQNVTGDEYIYVTAGWQYVHGDFAANREHPPTAKYLFGLAQLLGGQGALAPRILVGLLVLGVAAIIFFWLKREAGWWAGLASAAFWLLMPRANAGDRIDRLALLEPVMMFFAVAALFAGWRWARTGKTWMLAVSGALLGASVTSKVSTIALVPAFLLLPYLFTGLRRWRPAVRANLIWLSVFVVTAVALYLPMGMRSAIGYMLKVQDGQNVNGHDIPIAGHIYRFAPWWGNFWFLAEGIGVAALVVIVVGVALAIWLRPDKLIAYLGAALLLLIVFYTIAARIALPHYYYAWTPLLVILAGLGYARVAQRLRRPVSVSLLAVAALVALVAAVQFTVVVAQDRPTGIARVSDELRSHGVGDGPLLAVGMMPGVYVPYPALNISEDPSRGPFVAVVVGDDPRFHLDPTLKRLLKNERSRFTVITLDSLQLWVPHGLVEHGPTGFVLSS